MQAAVTEAQGRWINAGAGAAADLLRAIAAGTADAADPEVRRRCADEERYLRQLLSFDAGLLHLSPWLALGLAQARAMSVNLEIRGGSIDARDRESADLIGHALLAAVEACNERDRLRLSLFDQRGVTSCMILGPRHIADRVRLALPDETPNLHIRYQSERALIEIGSDNLAHA